MSQLLSIVEDTFGISKKCWIICQKETFWKWDIYL